MLTATLRNILDVGRVHRELLDQDIPDQPFDISGLTTTLWQILDVARIHHFTSRYGRCPNLRQKLVDGRITWQGFEKAKELDDYVFKFICGSAQHDVYRKYSAITLEEETYCQKIFNDVGYHGICVGASGRLTQSEPMASTQTSFLVPKPQTCISTPYGSRIY